MADGLIALLGFEPGDVTKGTVKVAGPHSLTGHAKGVALDKRGNGVLLDGCGFIRIVLPKGMRVKAKTLAAWVDMSTSSRRW